jgi:predicted dehydrogenase
VRMADAERMVTAARQAQRVLAVGMTRRFYPCLVEARRLLAEGLLGEDVRFVYREGDVYGWPASTDAPFRRATAGGGVLMDVGSHVLDSLVGLFGAPAVEGYEDDALRDGVEANCRVRLAFPAARGVVQLSWNQPLASGLHVMGSAGELRLDLVHMDRLRLRRGGGPWETVVSRHGWPADLAALPRRRATPRSYKDCVAIQLVQVLRAVAHGDPVPVDGDQALLTIRAITDCYRQARALPQPWLSAAERVAADALHWSQTA